MQYKIKVQIDPGGKLPIKAHKTDAGFDLFATSDISIAPGQVIKHPLNIHLELPNNSWAEVKSKSGLGARGLLVFAGVIDESYRGVIHVVMTNMKYKDEYNLFDTRKPIEIKKGEKLAQLILFPYDNRYIMEEVESIESNTERGSNGFGSSGRY